MRELLPRLTTWLKRVFSDTLQAPAPQKRPPHKVVRTKAQTAQKKLSDMAAKQGGHVKIKPAAKSGPKHGN